MSKPSFWKRLDEYRRRGPGPTEEPPLRSIVELGRDVRDLVDSELGPLEWRRRNALRWSRHLAPWAEKVLEFQSLKSGLGVKWGLLLSFVPPFDTIRVAIKQLHLSYDPLDYQRDVAPWSLSCFATTEEVKHDGSDLLRRAVEASRSLDLCGRDLVSLAACFEEKKQRKAVRLGFHQYPYERLAYATVLGLIGRKAYAEEELHLAFDRLEATPELQSRIRGLIEAVWAQPPEEVRGLVGR